MEAAMLELSASEPRERLCAFVEGVVRPLPHVRQRENALVYVRGLIEHGGRKSLQPTLFRLGESSARYESVQQFLADSPWEPEHLIRACAERVAPELGVLAWVVDDTGIAKDGKHSPGVKRQYSGTLGKIGNCQLAVSLHAVGERGTLPLGFSLYLPRGVVRRRKAASAGEVPVDVVFKTKPQLASSLVEHSIGWEIPQAPLLADCAYGDDTAFRTRLQALELEYLVGVSAQISVYGPETTFAVPERNGNVGRRRSVARADRKPESLSALAARLPRRAWKMLPYRTTAAGKDVSSRFAFVRVVATHPVRTDCLPPREEWLIIEWPPGEEAPSDYGSPTCPRRRAASGSPASPACAGRSNSTTASSRASSDSTTTKAEATPASITTARS